MKFTLLSRKKLDVIPSASGIEITGGSVYVMGDDSPWLFRMNRKWELEEKILIADVSAGSTGKIPKKQKPDLEAMASWGSTLLLFGSGSKSPQRDVLVCVDTAHSHAIKKYSLVQFYDSLCASSSLTRQELNLEAAAIINGDLFLFNRGKNRIFRLKADELLAHAERKGPLPSLELFCFTLASINGIEAGFSGAAVTPDSEQIIFTASVENTPNWIDDGEVLGSFVGIFPLNELKDGFRPVCVPVKDKENTILKIKVESVAVAEAASSGKANLLLVTDNDASTSELLEGELKW